MTHAARARAAAVALLACSLPLPATAQSEAARSAASIREPDGVLIFLQQTRTATRRYRDRGNAIADGYRRLGPAFPGMGEHWIHPGLIVAGRVDPAQPAVLCYADSAGTPMLAGLAYTAPVLPGGTLPATPFGLDVWHHHHDAVDAESLLLAHPGLPGGSVAGPTLAMFHVWPWLENPDGPFAQNNWALPFAQLGLEPPRHITASAAQALSLLTVGAPYYLRLLDVLVDPGAAERATMRALLDDAVRRTRSWHEHLTAPLVSEEAAQALERIWTELWQALERTAAPAARERLRSFAGAGAH